MSPEKVLLSDIDIDLPNNKVSEFDGIWDGKGGRIPTNQS